MFAGKNLQILGNSLQGAGKKLQGEAINLKILGDGLMFVEMIRKFEIRGADFLE